ncbi:hypothetical protein F5887DRAFT_517007 [Amanita rubescens]|nr:hypothetical protein F5887DRAFT_517007 [Amanita rubescens]
MVYPSQCHGPNMIMNVDPPSVPQSPRSISHPQLGIIPSASEVRRILGPLIAHNSLARNGTLEKETSSAEPRGDIQNLLTDEVCNKFAGQMRVVEKQRGTLPSNGTSNMDNNKVPKAPRAMLISEKVRVLEDYLLLQDHNKDLNVNNPNLDMRIPVPSSAIGTAPPSVHETAPSNSSSTGIAIPLETKFFTHAKNLEREEGEITSSRPPSVASDVARKASPVKRYSIDGGGYPRRSASPEPARHRLPVSRTYRNRSPERLVRPSSRRSKSPSHPRRLVAHPVHPKGLDDDGQAPAQEYPMHLIGLHSFRHSLPRTDGEAATMIRDAANIPMVNHTLRGTMITTTASRQLRATLRDRKTHSAPVME